MGLRSPALAGGRRLARRRPTPRRAPPDRLPAMPRASDIPGPGDGDPPGRRDDPLGPRRGGLALARPRTADPRVASPRAGAHLRPPVRLRVAAALLPAGACPRPG